MAASKFDDIHSDGYQVAFADFIASPAFRQKVQQKIKDVHELRRSYAITASDDCIIESRPDPRDERFVLIDSPVGGESARVAYKPKGSAGRSTDAMGDDLQNLDAIRNVKYHLAAAAVGYEFAKEHLTHQGLEAAMRQARAEQEQREELSLAFHGAPGGGHKK